MEEAFSVLKKLIVKSKHCKVLLVRQFLTPLNNVIAKATSLTEGKRSEYFNHLKAVADGLTALAWIGCTGKDCGMRMPSAHVEESWQIAELYCNKKLYNHVLGKECLLSSQKSVQENQ